MSSGQSLICFLNVVLLNVFGKEIAEISGKCLGADFESVARFWVADKKYKVLNVCSTAVLWAIWKLRNEFCFQGIRWEGVHISLRRTARMIRDWRLLSSCSTAGVGSGPGNEKWATSKANMV
jgi:hypothetical protein